MRDAGVVSCTRAQVEGVHAVEHRAVFSGAGLQVGLLASKVLGWPKRYRLGSYKRLKLTQLLGQLGVFLTRACCTAPSRFGFGFLVVTAAAAAAAPGVGCARMPSLTLADAAARRLFACPYATSQLLRLAVKSFLDSPYS